MFSLFIDYSKWHYTYALENIFRLAKEFIRFFLNLFSVTLFLKTFFRPIFSVPVNLHEAEDAVDTVSLIVGGVLIRIFGALFRLLLIILGLFFCMMSVVFFTCVFFVWLLMPVIFVVGISVCLHVL
jgi:hypothetical protein